MATNLPSQKSKNISIIFCFMDLHHSFHRGLHVVWYGTEEQNKDSKQKGLATILPAAT